MQNTRKIVNSRLRRSIGASRQPKRRPNTHTPQTRRNNHKLRLSRLLKQRPRCLEKEQRPKSVDVLLEAVVFGGDVGDFVED
jgi:hypothetical protein